MYLFCVGCWYPSMNSFFGSKHKQQTIHEQNLGLRMLQNCNCVPSSFIIFNDCPIANAAKRSIFSFNCFSVGIWYLVFGIRPISSFIKKYIKIYIYKNGPPRILLFKCEFIFCFASFLICSIFNMQCRGNCEVLSRTRCKFAFQNLSQIV